MTPAESPYRDRPKAESLDLFRRMRGRICGRPHDASRKDRPRLRQFQYARPGHLPHQPPAAPPHGRQVVHLPDVRFCAPIEDAMEHITHSLCSLEFEDHRPLYDWVIAERRCPSKPRQIEFARLGINNTVMSKRKAARACGGRRGQRLGRPAHADALRPAPARLHAGGYPQFLRAHRRGQVTARSTTASWNTACGGPEPDRQARHGRSGACEADHHELP